MRKNVMIVLATALVVAVVVFAGMRSLAQPGYGPARDAVGLADLRFSRLSHASMSRGVVERVSVLGPAASRAPSVLFEAGGEWTTAHPGPTKE
jgi:hypothetical protein